MAPALINVPAKARRGDVIEIKALTSHIMETGYRRTAAGEIVPRDIITSFVCRFNGAEVDGHACEQEHDERNHARPARSMRPSRRPPRRRSRRSTRSMRPLSSP